MGSNIAASKVVDAMNRSDDEEMQCAINKMKNGKISGPSVVYKILKTGGVRCLNYLIAIFTMISSFRLRCKEVWMLSSLVPIFKREIPSVQIHIGE